MVLPIGSQRSRPHLRHHCVWLLPPGYNFGLRSSHGTIQSDLNDRNRAVCFAAFTPGLWQLFTSERTARRTYRTRDEARADVFDYIERFYNPARRHSTLGYLSPVEFENRAKLA